MKKKIFSVAIAAAMMASSLTAMAAPISFTQDMSGVSTNGTGYTWLSGTLDVNGMKWSSGSGWSGAFGGDKQYNFSVPNGILGKLEGDKSWKWSLKQNAGWKSMQMNSSAVGNTTNTTDGKTFYMQQNVYVDEFVSPNVLMTGGESYLGSARKMAFVAFGPDGRIYKSRTLADNNVLFDGYEAGNWYNVTMEFVANNGVTNVGKAYIDGKEIEAYAFDGSAGTDAVQNAYMISGWQYDNAIIASDNNIPVAEQPFWTVFDDLKLVEGAFNPMSVNPDITSTTFTVTNPTFQASGSVKNAKISGIPSGATVADLKAGIAPALGGEIRVVTINPQSDASLPVLDSDDFKTVVAADNDELTPEHKLISVTSGGALKIYDLEVEEPSAYEATLSSSEYTVNNDELTISMIARGTKISRFIGNLTPAYGATVKVLNVIGEEVTEGYINNNLKVVVTSYDEKAVNEYAVEVETGYISDYRGSNSYLADTKTGLIQKLLGGSGKTVDGVAYSGAASGRRNSMAGFYGGTWSNVPGTDTATVANFSKVIDADGEAAFEFENSSVYNVYRALSGRTLVPYNGQDKGDNIVLKYSIRPMAPGRYVVAWDIIAADSTGKVYSTWSNEPLKPQDVTNRATPNIAFQTTSAGRNDIVFGTREQDAGHLVDIGDWEIGEQYDIVQVMKKLDATTDAWYVKHLSINGKEIDLAKDATNLSDGSLAGVGVHSGEYFKVNNKNQLQGNYASYIPSEIATDANRNDVKSWSWNTVKFSVASFDGVTPGKVNYNNIEVYTANDYVVEEEISLTSKTLEVYEEDKILKRATIKGFAGTVADLEAAVTMPEGAFLVVKNADGEILSDDATLAGGMTATVYSADCSAEKTYLLSDAIDMGKYYLFDSTGFIPVEKITDTDGTLTVQRTIRKYDLADITEFTMVAAVYDRTTNRLLAVDSVTEADYNETDGLILPLDLSKFDTANIYVKTLLLDSFAGAEPYCGSLIIAEDVQENAPAATNQ